MDILPAIDLRGGKCVRLLQGDYARQIDYSNDPLAVAHQFEQAGARWVHIVDLDGARDGTIRHISTIRRIARQTTLQLEVGGGVRDAAAIDALLEAGAARVVVGTRALEDPDWFGTVAHTPAYAHKLCLGLDARAGVLAVRGWTQPTERTALEVVEAVADWPLAAIIYTDIARDGMLAGPNIEAVRTVAERSGVPVIASGGVTRLDDVRALAGLPLAGIIIGRALYEGTIDLAEAMRLVAAR